MRSNNATLAVTVLILTLGTSAASLARPKSITLPAETATLKGPSEPGQELTAGTCMVCHSVDYISMQPRGKGKDFWAAEVTKMIAVYGATVPEADRAAIIEYLARNY